MTSPSDGESTWSKGMVLPITTANGMEQTAGDNKYLKPKGLNDVADNIYLMQKKKKKI